MSSIYHHKIRSWIVFLSPIAFLIVLWGVAVEMGWLPQVPSPQAVFKTSVGIAFQSNTYVAYWDTLLRTLISFVISAVAGVVFGAVIGAAGSFSRGIESVVDFLRSIPAPALLPIFMSLFGLYAGPKIALAVFVCLLVNIIYTSYGIKREARSLRSLWVRTLSSSKWFVFRTTILPAATEDILGGLRVTLSLALVLSTLAEFVLMTGHGAGVMIRIAYEDNEPSKMYGLILLLGIMGFGLNKTFLAFERWILRRQYPGSKLSGVF